MMNNLLCEKKTELYEKKMQLLIMKAKLRGGDTSLVKEIRLLKKHIARLMLNLSK